MTTASGKTLRELGAVRMFDHLYFTYEKVIMLQASGIPYADEWFWPLEAKTEGLRCRGSVGGDIIIGWDERVIDRNEPQGTNGKLLAPPN